MTAFTTTLGYTLGLPLKAKIRAHNEIGWGELSEVNTVTILSAGKPTIGPDIATH